LQVDFIVSCMTTISIVLSWDGFLIIDYIVAILVTFALLGYSVYFLWDSCKGLMDGSTNSHLLGQISDHIREADKRLKLKTLKVRRVGVTLEVVAQVSMPKNSSVSDLKNILQNVNQKFTDTLPHEHVTNIGFSRH
ncbi:MAG: divalent metal cation (Fe/Co/Zn/Cd) transporter, partial [Candidatus Omnitrophota bacterium]